MCNINKDRNSKSQKEVLENKNTLIEIECLSWVYQQTDTTEEKSLSPRLCQQKLKQREKTEKIKGLEYPRTVAEL